MRILPLSAMLLAAACSTKPTFFNEYKIDIQQGNVLEQHMIAQLQPGQTREQVRFLLGTPTLTDIFHQNRWDYPYRYQTGSTGEVEMRTFSVFFDQEGRLTHVAGNVRAVQNSGNGSDSHNDSQLNGGRSRMVDLSKLSEEQMNSPTPERRPPTWGERILRSFGW